MDLSRRSNWTPSRPDSHRPQWLLLAGIAAVCLALSQVLVTVSVLVGVALILVLAVGVICFISTEASLYVLIFSMLLSPEIGMGGLAGEATTASRGVTIRSEDLLLVVMCLSWLLRMAVHKELGLLRRTPLNRSIGAYTAACVLATGAGMLFGHVQGITGFFFVLKYIEYFVIYFVVSNNVHGRSQIRRFTISLLVTALIVSVVAILQIPGSRRVTAPFEGEGGEPNTLGGYLLFVGAVAGGLLLNVRDRRRRRLLGLLLAVMVVPFLATLSRGSYLGLPFAYLGLVALARRGRAAMVAAMILVGALGAAVMPRVVVDRILHTFQQEGHQRHARVKLGDVQLDTSTSARLHQWQEALADAVDSPIWGYGVTGYGFVDAQYPRVLVETGLIGVVTFGLLILAVYRQAMALYRRASDPLYVGLAMGLLAGLAGLLVHAVGANTFTIVRIMEPFWLTVGLVVCAGRLEEEAGSLKRAGSLEAAGPLAQAGAGAAAGPALAPPAEGKGRAGR